MKAMIHSLEDVREVELIQKIGPNEYIVRYENTYCTAIYNCFFNLFYADDKYGIVDISGERT